MKKVRFGILSTAKIGLEKVIPALQNGSNCEVTAIASRNIQKAEGAAASLQLSRAYGTYDELLNDPDIDAVYIPLPNHMHVPWSIKALEKGKHVLCEKPIGLSSKETRKLIAVADRHPDLKIMEAFMYRHHPRWQRALEMIKSDTIGDLKAIHSFFSYYNNDPGNIRNDAEIGGGGLMDIGCYSISLSRFLFGRQPDSISGAVETDPDFKTDRLASGVLDFGSGTSVFTCSTQCFRHQYVKIFGTVGLIEMDWPFNTPADESTTLQVSLNETSHELRFEPCNQYTIQGDLFAKSILEGSDVPTPLDDALKNMEVIDSFRAEVLHNNR